MLAAPHMLWTSEVIPSLPQLTPLLPLHHEVAFKTICLLGCFFMGHSCNTDYCIILFKSVCSPFTPLFLPTPDLTTRKRSHFWEVTSMHVPCWVVTFDFLRPFMSHTHQPRKLQTHFTTMCTTVMVPVWYNIVLNTVKINVIYSLWLNYIYCRYSQV